MNLFDTDVISPAQSGRYQCVYADPSWNESGGGRRARDTKVRNGIILLHGADVPPALRDEIARLVGTRLNDEPTEFLVSGADSECYDYFDEECE